MIVCDLMVDPTDLEGPVDPFCRTEGAAMARHVDALATILAAESLEP